MSMTKGLGRRQPSHAAFLAAAFAVVSLLVPRETQAGPPSIVFNPIVWDYGTIDAGTTASKTFVLTNLGDSATGSSLTVSLSSPWAFSKIADTCTGVSLSPKKSCTVTVQYIPTNFGTSDNATLSASGKKPAAVATATLTGMAGQPDLVLSPGSLATAGQYVYLFGEVAAATQTFTVTNIGTGASDILSLSDVSGGVTQENCSGQVLAPGQTCTFDLAVTTPAGCSPGEWFRATVALHDLRALLVFILDAYYSCPAG